MCNNLCVTARKKVPYKLWIRVEKANYAFVTPLLNNIKNKVTELKVSELSFKHMFNEKEPIVSDN